MARLPSPLCNALLILALVPLACASAPSAFNGLPTPYTTIEGDSLFKLAAESDLAVDIVRELNSHVTLPVDVNASMPVGLALSLPGKPAVPPCATTVRISSHADVDALAAAYQLNITAKQAVNYQMVCLNHSLLHIFQSYFGHTGRSAWQRAPCPQCHPAVR